jgi:hypothetical protein
MEKIANMTRRALLQRIAQMGGFAGASVLLAGCNIGNRKGPVMKPVAPSNPAPVSSVAAAPAVANAVTNKIGTAPVVATENLNQFGMNTWALTDWDGSFAFVDAMKHARPWQTIDMKGIAPADENGWPLSDAGTVIYTGDAAHINGTYKLIFNGQGMIGSVYNGYTMHVANQQYDASTNTTTADITFSVTKPAPGASVGISIRNSQRTPTSAVGSGFSNMRLYRPGYPTDGSVVFASYYVHAMQVGSTIRTMDWSATNGNTTVNWADRNTPLTFQKPIPPYIAHNKSSMGGTPAGSQSTVALEHHIQLANQTGRDLWINVPVIASDDFVIKMAQTLLYGSDGTNPYTSPRSNPVYPPLNSNLNVYIEYANETWNTAGGFWCYYVIMDIVQNLPASHPIYAIAPQTSIYYTAYRYTAYRISQVSDLFRSVFGDSAMMTRVRPVLMSQKGTGGTFGEGFTQLTWLDQYGAQQNPPKAVNSYVYGSGGSAYYGVNNMSSDPDTYFAPGNYPDRQTVASFPNDAMAAKNWGLQRIAYEGGDGVDYIPTAQKLAINADPRIETMTEFMHNYWSQEGGDLLMYYTLTGAADWEFTPDILNLNTPKYNALRALKGQTRAPVTLGQVLPGEMLFASLPRLSTAGAYSTTVNGQAMLGGINRGLWVAAPANSNASFSGSITVNGTAGEDSVLAIWINGKQVGTVTLAKNDSLEWSSAVTATIPQGLVMVRVQLVSGNFGLRSVNIQKG